mmetsp:Transcript_15470/g.20053  ORF Transcript_15470/g.20053 Transcript_15470/m.20053 type:complete len:129 (+) Transcript_15470:161-547(+)
MPHVTKVLLGAAAVTSNGAVLGRIGTAVVAMTAKCKNIPVIVTCETYKLCEKVPLDSIVSNELGDPADLERPDSESNHSNKSNKYTLICSSFFFILSSLFSLVTLTVTYLTNLKYYLFVEYPILSPCV